MSKIYNHKDKPQVIKNIFPYSIINTNCSVNSLVSPGISMKTHSKNKSMILMKLRL